MEAGRFRNLIFDLGGVIMNLAEDRTVFRFAALSGLSIEEVRRRVLDSEIYETYEKGRITEGCFREGIRKQLKLDVSDAVIDDAFNAMLLDIPRERIRLLERLKERYNLYLISNTNTTHFRCFHTILYEVMGVFSWDVYFNKTYYSHLVQKRKPDKEIFEMVLSENGLVPSETLFLDDKEANLIGAHKLDIQTFHVYEPSLLFTLFP